MYSLKIVFVLTLVAFANANPHPVKEEETDADLFRKFIECARLAIVYGIPEIDVPSHEPLVITHDIKYEFNETGVITGFVSIDHMVMTNISNWEVRQFDALTANDDGVETFNYTIYWRDMILTGDWEYSLHILDEQLDNNGTLSFELDHINFAGIFNYTKAGPNRAQTINDLDLHITTEDVEINIPGFGVLSDIIHDLGEGLLPDLINVMDYTELSEGLKTKIINDWILKPERLDAIITHCQN